jgi:ParB-like chromosome segregation protein Spo0J
MEVRRVSLDQIHADPANLNTHDEKNLRAIRGSLKEFGQVEPLVVHKETGKVIGGNGRLEAMRALGWTECDIVEVDSDGVHATALGIALNRTAKTSVFDDDALARTLRALQDEDFNLDSVGFTDAEVDALFGVGDGDDAGGEDEPEAREPWQGRFEIVIELASEAEQQEVFERLTADGLKCRVLTM